jgi:hypothetical protein
VSRLIEMQSENYLLGNHIPDWLDCYEFLETDLG